MLKKEPRLQFTDEERMDPELGKSVKKAEKAASKAEKAQAKIPTKKKLKSELKADPATGKMKVKLGFEEAKKKPPSRLSFTTKEAPGDVVRGQIHREIRESEDDNVGVEAVHQLEETAEGAGYVLREGHHHQQLKPYRDAAKAESQLEKANVQYLQKKAEVENPSSNPASKWHQKQAIKRQYAAAKSGKTTETTQKTAQKAGEAAKKAAEATEKAAEWVWEHKKGVAIVAGILLLLSFMLSGLSSCTVFLESIGGAVVQSSYHHVPAQPAQL